MSITDKFLVKYAKFVDDIDMFTGPYFEAAEISGNETAKEIALYGRLFEYGIVKIPFMLTYIAKTKDLRAFLEWIPKETFALNVPYGGFVQIFRRYEHKVKEYYRKGII